MYRHMMTNICYKDPVCQKGIVILVVLLSNKNDIIMNTSKWTQHNNMEGTVSTNETGSVHLTTL